MTEREQRCVPDRKVHAFNGNAICQCGRMHDDGTPVELAEPIEITRGSEAGGAIEIPVALAGAPAMSLRAATMCVEAIIARGTPIDPRELQEVAAAMRRVCADVGLDVANDTRARSTR